MALAQRATAFAAQIRQWVAQRNPVWLLVLPTIAALATGVALVAYYLPGLMQSAAIEAAYRSNIDMAEQMKISRDYYAEHVVAKAMKSGVLRPDIAHGDDPHALPFPATVLKDISELTRDRSTTFVLVSPYPWPHRTDRTMDDFQTGAWQTFQQNPQAIVRRQDVVGGKRVLRVAVADVMTRENCIACHNAHPQSAKQDWKLGDVRGVMEVSRLIEPYLAAGEQRGRMVAGVLAVSGLTVCLLLLAFTFLVARRTREKREADARLRDAFDLIPQGIVLLDAEDRFVLWNKQYANLCVEREPLIAKGVRFGDVLRAGVDKGVFVDAIGREDDWLALRMARHRLSQNSEERQLSDGRWVRIEERRTSDGGSIGLRIDITGMKQREETLRLLFENNPLPMWVYDVETLEFLDVNTAAIDHYGYSRERFARMTLLDIRPAEDHDKVRAFCARIKGEDYSGNYWRHLKADGTEIYVVTYARALTYKGRKASIVAVLDSTERKRAEEELASTREFLDTIIENVPASIIVKNAKDMTYAFVNRAAEKTFGYSRNDVVGKTSADIFAPEMAAKIAASDRLLLETRGDMVMEGLPTLTPGNGLRFLTTTRLPIFDKQGEAQYLLSLFEDVTDRKQAEARIAHMAHHDHLTDLPNRASFNQQFEQAIARAAESGQSFAILSIDFDRFKEINDVFGHITGDMLLTMAAQRLKAAAEGAFLARIGGDEFIVIVEGDGLKERIDALAARLVSAIHDSFEFDGRQFRIGLSIGIAVYPLDANDAATLVANADAALYRAKTDGRGAIRYFKPEMDRKLREGRALQRDLEAAIAAGGLSLEYQPQARIGGGIVGFEALVRWRHATRGPVPPSTFIPIAEESGLILSLGEWVLREACSEAASWPNPLRVAVNLSPVQFKHGDLPALVHAILLETGLSASRLELEITENVLIGDFSRALSILRRLKALGVRISIDDFGSGYSSLSYLQSFPFDKIKIDRAFVSHMDRDAQSLAIVRAVIGLCRGFDRTVLAEGVETQSQLDALTREKCDEVQGYLIGRPQPIARQAALVGRAPEPREALKRA